MRLTLLVASLLLAAPASATAEPAATLPGSVAASENAGTVRIPVTLSEPAPGAVEVSWRTLRPMIPDAPLAKAGKDYVEGSGRLAFAAGETRGELAVTVLDDAVDDDSPFLAVELHDPQGATIGPQRMVAFELADDEPTPPASAADVVVKEGAGEAVVRITRPAISLVGHAAYTWTPRPVTARAPQDFSAETGRGAIAYGKTELLAYVRIADDDRDEPAETFELVLAPDPFAGGPFSGFFPGPLGDAVATITIADDDPPAAAARVVRVRRISGLVRADGKVLSGTAPLARGAAVDARRGTARIAVARGGAVLRTATIAGGRVRLTRARDLQMASRRLLVRSTGMAVRARSVRTDPMTPGARWTLRERAAGTQVRVLAGRVKAGGMVLRAGPPRLFG
jgi:hypothetical protein